MNYKSEMKTITVQLSHILPLLFLSFDQHGGIVLIDSLNVTIGVLVHKNIYGFTTRMSHMGGALEIGIENINKNNSILNNKAVNYDIQYSQRNKRKVLSKTNDLILNKSVDVIIGDACSVTSEYAGLLAAEYNLPFITFSTSNDNLDNRTVYNTLTMVKGTLDALGQVIIQASKGNGLSNICLYSSQRSYLTFIERGMERGSKLNNVTIIDKINHKEAENFRPTMRIVKQNCRGMAIIFSH